MTKTTGTKPAAQARNAPTVLIVGAGPTGLTLACELACRGVSFRLIEAAPAGDAVASPVMPAPVFAKQIT